MNKINYIMLLCICLAMASCNIPQSGTTDEQPQIETIVAATSQALTLQAGVNTQTYAPSFTNSVEPTGTLTQEPLITSTIEPGFGSISGNISGYPYGSIPQMVIVALEQQPPYHYWYLITTAGDSYFSMDGYISSGKYQVVAYDYLGHSGGCLTIIQVKNNEMSVCSITDWSGSYPAKPAGVP